MSGVAASSINYINCRLCASSGSGKEIGLETFTTEGTERYCVVPDLWLLLKSYLNIPFQSVLFIGSRIQQFRYRIEFRYRR